MVSTSIFETLWPIIKIFQILGMFPIKKTEGNFCGFQSISTGKYLILTIAVQGFAFTCNIFVMSYMITKYDISFTTLWKVLFAVTESKLDATVLTAIILLLVLSSFILIVGLFPLRSNMISLLETCAKVDILDSGLAFKMKLFFLLLTILLFPFFMSFGVAMRLVHQIKLTLIEITLLGSLYFVSFVIASGPPLFSFLIMFSEACYQIQGYI